MFEELAAKAKLGDLEAKEEIIKSLQPLILSSIKRYYYKRNEFEDLLQDGNIKILECIEDFQPQRGVFFLGYVKTMLRYMYLDKHKKKTTTSLNEKVGEGETEIIDLLASDEKDILESILDVEEKKELEKVLEILTERQKEIIILFYMEKISIADIGSKLGISYRTVVNTKTVALKKLNQGLLQNHPR